MGRKIVTMVLLAILICSCPKQPKATIYMKPNDNEDVLNGLRVENEEYQTALARCQERLHKYQESSIEAADIYSLMGEIYADYVGDRDQAVYYIEKSIEIHQQFNDEIGLVQDYGGRAEVSFFLDEETEEGLDYIIKAGELYRKNGLEESFGLAAVLSRKGEMYKQTAQYEDALAAFREAQNIM